MDHRLADGYGIPELRFIYHLGIIPFTGIAQSSQRLQPLAPHRIDHRILPAKIALCHKFYNIGIIAARKSPVGGDQDNALFLRRIPSLLSNIWIPRTAGLRQHAGNGLIHFVEIRFRLLRVPLCLLQLYSGDQLHCLGYLGSALNTRLTPFNVPH